MDIFSGKRFSETPLLAVGGHVSLLVTNIRFRTAGSYNRYTVYFSRPSARLCLVSAFEYLSVFISIILGLAVVHLLGGVSLLLDQRVVARIFWVHMAWVLNMFSLITWVWWANWQLNGVESFSPAHYVSMVLFSVVLYLMCGLLFPVRGKEVENFYEQFEINRTRFFYLGEVLLVAALLKGYVDRQVLSEPDTLERTVMFATLAVLFGIASRSRSRVFHGALAVVFFALTLRWIFTE